MPVSWPDDVDEVLGGDLTAALAYVTPAGGAVVTPVAPVGLRDREQGTVTFTTSLGFGRKLKRIERDPSVALAYHAREHGFAFSEAFVLVQGRCRPVARARSRTGTSACSARRRLASWGRRGGARSGTAGCASTTPTACRSRSTSSAWSRGRRSTARASRRCTARLGRWRRPSRRRRRRRAPRRAWTRSTAAKRLARLPARPARLARGRRLSGGRRRRDRRLGARRHQALGAARASCRPAGVGPGLMGHCLQGQGGGAPDPAAHGLARGRRVRAAHRGGFRAPSNKTLSAAGERPAGEAGPAQGAAPGACRRGLEPLRPGRCTRARTSRRTARGLGSAPLR